MKHRLEDITLEDINRTVELILKIEANAKHKTTPAFRMGGYKRTEEQIAADFWDRVEIKTAIECWPWTRATMGKGPSIYGCFSVNGKHRKAHQYAATQMHGPKPVDLLACHKCDNTICCNPIHIYYGTHKDNHRDCKERNRLNRNMGSRRYNAILTEEQVAQIKAEAPFRKRGWGKAMALKYGVGRTAIGNVVSGFRWKQVAAAGHERTASS